MRRFSSEGSLLDLDFLPWKKMGLKNPDHQKNPESAIYIPQLGFDGSNRESVGLTPTIQEPNMSCSEVSSKELNKEQSFSAENLEKLERLEQNRLRVCAISEGCRAYSDSQLSPAAQNSTACVAKKDLPLPPSPSSSCNSSCFNFQHGHQDRPRLSTAKLHLKSLFGQSPHSSHSNLLHADQKDSARERRSRMLFMRQWSQVGHSKKRKIGRDELEKWAESLNSLLASNTGVSVFGAFLRSEFSEENLEFYLACEQYKQSSNNFSLQRRAKNICTTYILPGAPREVNLDSKIRDLTIQMLQAPSRNSLLHAQKRIYSLLDTDCYPRFLQSSIYLSLLQEDD
ncbi:regulator of G-protein signaling 1 [Melanotaenia boesemani]|uniref:regulator of G-protein signaling 1 n=1 Tax=Melanotaenia boesemani TaxID=1250792 RepID=UPI001C051F36|nr:regulator of G-protein signaling 1 [Melanotaenia boesemani]XP_041868263.1 regulator of G-protein signaling 1 [Melanotaenia boesemani]XP_041868264.1 regulator of G-protein signaling 1 [Melanotaenia boesemani]XP_041868265.1 regulator of G-protein signaling 1 [Melanotaenia boesemani]